MLHPTSTLAVFDVLTDFLASEPSPQEILEYRLPANLEARAAYLLQLKREERLGTEEEAEFYDFVRADDFMTLLKAKTRLKHAGKA